MRKPAMILLALLRCRHATALIEFALILPILLLFLLGAIELARYVIIHQKLDKTAFAMADYVTQATTIREGDFDGFVRAVPEIMYPYNFSGTVVFSSAVVQTTASATCPINTSCVAWQRSRLGGDASRIGAQSGPAILPGGYTILSGQDVVIAEVFYNYQPMLINVSQRYIPAFAPHLLYKVALYKPRQGRLTTIQP